MTLPTPGRAAERSSALNRKAQMRPSLPFRPVACAVACFFALTASPHALSAQAEEVPAARAVRTETSMRLDGRDDEAVWRTAPATDDFRQFTPGEAAPARFRTEFKVAYDDRTLYVFVRAFDPRTDSLVALLSRRDERTPSEWIKIVIDGFRDRRNALQFMVNPAGVKRDATVYSDVQEDNAWDGVWDVAVDVDSASWTAEYAIPFSQLRFALKDELTFGFGGPDEEVTSS